MISLRICFQIVTELCIVNFIFSLNEAQYNLNSESEIFVLNSSIKLENNVSVLSNISDNRIDNSKDSFENFKLDKLKISSKTPARLVLVDVKQRIAKENTTNMHECEKMLLKLKIKKMLEIPSKKYIKENSINAKPENVLKNSKTEKNTKEIKKNINTDSTIINKSENTTTDFIKDDIKVDVKTGTLNSNGFVKIRPGKIVKNVIKVNGKFIFMSENISKPLKLNTTASNLERFVAVPENIHKTNKEQISKRVKRNINSDFTNIDNGTKIIEPEKDAKVINENKPNKNLENIPESERREFENITNLTKTSIDHTPGNKSIVLSPEHIPINKEVELQNDNIEGNNETNRKNIIVEPGNNLTTHQNLQLMSNENFNPEIMDRNLDNKSDVSSLINSTSISPSVNNYNNKSVHECYIPEMHLLSVKFKLNGTLNETSSLYGRINETEIVVGIYLFRSGTAVPHMGTLYGSSFNRNLSKSIIGSNEQVKTIFENIATKEWPYNRDVPLMRKHFIEQEMNKMNYTVDNSSESNEFIREFMDNFDLDLELNYEECFCSIYTQNRSEEINEYLICFTPWISKEQIDILYAVSEEEKNYITASGIAYSVSIVFIFFTIIVYIILPELRKIVYGKCIFLYLISLFISYSLFSIIVLSDERLGVFCRPIGFTVQFTWLTCFTLQTVMCLDILLAFRKIKPLLGSKIGDNAKLGIYCLYAYGIPAVITLTTITLQYSSILKQGNKWKPNLDRSCFFPKIKDNKRVRWLYFYGPYGGMIFLNFCIFLGTAMMIIRHSRAASATFKGSSFRKSTSNNQNKVMFRAHLTLFFVMGTNWITELIILILKNTTTPDSLFWQIFDTLNNLIGPVLFVVLICKKQVLKSLSSKFNTWRKKVKSLSSLDENDSKNINRTSTQASTLSEEMSSSKL